MSLRAFHVVFISASVVLAFGFAAWCLRADEAAGLGRTLAGLAAIGAGLGLAAYELWFVRKLGRLP